MPDNEFILKDQTGKPIIEMRANENYIVLRNKASKDNVFIHADPVKGGCGIGLIDQDGKSAITMEADARRIKLQYENSKPAISLTKNKIAVHNTLGNETIKLVAEPGLGDWSGIFLQDPQDPGGKSAIELRTDNNSIVLNSKTGPAIWLHTDPARLGCGISLNDQGNHRAVELSADHHEISLSNIAGNETVVIRAEADPAQGGCGIDLRNQAGNITTFAVNADESLFALRNRANKDNVVIHADTNYGGYCGINLRNQAGKETVVIRAEADPAQGGCGIDLGNGTITTVAVNADDSIFALRNKAGKDNVVVHADTNYGGYCGINLCNQAGKETVVIRAEADPAQGGCGIDLRNQAGNITTFAVNADESLFALRNRANKDNVVVRADPCGIELQNQAGIPTIQVDGELGDIKLLNSDCAEEFEVMAAESVEPGTVMVLNENGQLEKGTQPYDKRVAGVVSGAGDLKPGLVLGRQPGRTDSLPIALIGKVYCKVDANDEPIEVGDLLTTSVTPGYARKASDPARAFGAVLGKALRPLATGTGLIPILVTLQ